MHVLVGTLGLALCLATSEAKSPNADGSAAQTEQQGSKNVFQRLTGQLSGGKRTHPLAPPPQGRKFMVGLEGVVFSAPPVQPEVIRLDPRFVGRSVALGGIGLFGRFRPISLLAVELGARSGSLRYNSTSTNNAVSQDQVAIDAAALLYLARGNVAQFALSGGVGGMWNRVGYQERGESSRQTFGSVLFRVGGEAEFLLKRVAFTLAFRNYAILTFRDQVNNRGIDKDVPAPVSKFQSSLMGSIGIAFRF